MSLTSLSCRDAVARARYRKASDGVSEMVLGTYSWKCRLDTTCGQLTLVGADGSVGNHVIGTADSFNICCGLLDPVVILGIE